MGRKTLWNIVRQSVISSHNIKWMYKESQFLVPTKLLLVGFIFLLNHISEVVCHFQKSKHSRNEQLKNQYYDHKEFNTFLSKQSTKLDGFQINFNSHSIRSSGIFSLLWVVIPKVFPNIIFPEIHYELGDKLSFLITYI